MDYNRERKELFSILNVKLTRNWSASIYNRQDLTDGGGSLEHGGSLTYEDDCSIFSFQIRQDDSSDPEYEGDFEITFNFFLKTLGGAGN